MPIDASRLPFSMAWIRHYTPEYFRKNVAAKILGTGAGGASVSWSGSSGLQSCAVRMSIALAYAGAHFPQIRNRWRLKGTSVHFPTLAGDYPEIPILANGESLTGSVVEKQARVRGRGGVIYFGGAFSGASGHLTLWNGSALHFPSEESSYWSQPTVVFWRMAT